MLKLRNIKRNETVIECDIIPEDSNHAGHMIVDMDSGNIQEYSLPDGYEWCRNHVNHAQTELLKLSREKDIPGEKLVMWY